MSWFAAELPCLQPLPAAFTSGDSSLRELANLISRDIISANPGAYVEL